jgi:hypothetical protein
MNKQEYIEAIIKMLESTHDTQLIDYIYKLLQKCA